MSDLSTNTRSSLSRAHLALGHMTQTKLPASRSSSWWSAWASWFTVCKPEKYQLSLHIHTNTTKNNVPPPQTGPVESENMGFYFTPGTVTDNLTVSDIVTCWFLTNAGFTQVQCPHFVSRAGRTVMIHWVDWKEKLQCFILLSEK